MIDSGDVDDVCSGGAARRLQVESDCGTDGGQDAESSCWPPLPRGEISARGEGPDDGRVRRRTRGDHAWNRGGDDRARWRDRQRAERRPRAASLAGQTVMAGGRPCVALAGLTFRSTTRSLLEPERLRPAGALP